MEQFNQQYPATNVYEVLPWRSWMGMMENDNGCPCGAYCSGTCRRCPPRHRIIRYDEDDNIIT